MKPISKELKKYIKYLEIQAKKFRLSKEDLSNLYDLMNIVDNPPEIDIDFRKTLKMNKMDKWFYKLRGRIEDIVIWGEGKK